MTITPETTTEDWERGETFAEFAAAGFYVVDATGARGSRVTYLPPGYFGDEAQVKEAGERAHRAYVEHHRDNPQDPLYN